MGEYVVSTCADRAGTARMSRDTAVFVRRIEPRLDTVYTIICDDNGRARPFVATGRSGTLIHTGPIRVSTDCVYLATWIPASELPRQGNVVDAVRRLGRDDRYATQPTRDDERRRRLQASRWQGESRPLPMADAALVDVLGNIGLGSLAPQALVAEPLVRRELARRLIEDLEDVKQRELGAGFILGMHDEAGSMRDRMLTNPAYLGATPERRAEMITEWQRRLEPAAR